MAKVVTYSTVVRVTGLLILAFSLNVICAQNNYHLIIKSLDRDSNFAQKDLALKTTFQNKLQCNDYVQKLPLLLQSKGFIAASVDSVEVTDTYSSVYLFLGQQYSLGNIKVQDQDELFLEQVLGKRKFFYNSNLNFTEYQNLQQKLLNYFDNNGYPFAKVQLDSIAINDQKIDASLKIDKGILYKIDSIRIYGSAKISRNFIHHYLNIERGSFYKKDRLESINTRLLELPYLQQMQNWDITMLSAGSIINLYLKPKKSNQINVLAGFLPSNQQTGGKLLLTVDANLQLKNPFGSGESIGVLWQQTQPQSPRLNIQYTQPFIFNSPFGIDFLFELYKKDSTFLNINMQAGLQYVLSGNQTGRISIQNTRSNVLLADTLGIKSLKKLPDVADVSNTNLGIDYEYNKTSYRYNPRSGNELKVSLTAGDKKIRKSNAVTQIKDTSFNYNQLYDSLQLNSYQFRLKILAAHYFTLGKQSVLKTGLNGGWYESRNYFRNELFQIGGYRLLRGFDEESIYANKYLVTTIEYRYLLGLNSYFFGFTDVGWSKNNSLAVPASNQYTGAGVGLSFETKGGLFNVSVAAGKRNDLPFNIRETKIHFGYVSVF